MRKLLIISLILFGLSPLVKGQMLNLNYQMSVPLGKMNDYAGKMSFRGMDLEYHHFLNEKFSIGGMIGWNTFYKDKGKLTGDFLFKGSKDIHTITGYQYRYINTVPIMVMGRYWLTDQNTMFRPYLGLGLGTSWTELKTDLGQFTATNARWQFAFAPEIGTIIPVNDQFAFNIGVINRGMEPWQCHGSIYFNLHFPDNKKVFRFEPNPCGYGYGQNKFY